ncbi:MULTISPECIES: hypothetical protein [unclassified Bradyrhizobium]|uniref:hypothetical protein n=1 Tax=unclassified Bradyrhizobium TaxID=2631580 RepID=UPI00211DAA67|nr:MULTISPECIES: hypothetical protein [unclassified Bradyrhizobium]MDD1533043.1 hypothetical protein [Bradyrhizobium sp. WBOS8]MDD1582697.1 hypothetical protein [Bradyrhizobium sp. WBOS4]UUO48433.1 hypothetical protein DCM78_16865 [Bradyrhizobium sp. WBOS04]UUO62055.1 hypothetical protein DCM80_24610 [Bradyrhizobium sp. WBOS08]
MGDRKDDLAAVAIVAFCAGMSVSFFTLPVWVGFMITVAREGSRTDWLGFAGAIVGAAATLLAAGGALFAAFKTLKPIRDQLNQLMRQNDHSLIDRLGLRAAKLNDESIAVQQVAADCEVVRRALEPFDRETVLVVPAIAGLREAVTRLESSVKTLQRQRGDVWGDVAVQSLRNDFVDIALRAGSRAIGLIMDAERDAGAFITNLPIAEWAALSGELHTLAARLFFIVKQENARVGKTLAEVESRLL